MTKTSPDPVMSVSDARAGLSVLISRLRVGASPPVVIGSHRRPQAVLLSYVDFRRMTDGLAPITGSLLEGLRSRRDLITRLARASRLDSVAVFGSVARGEDGPDSDLDLLVDTTPETTLFDIAQFGIDVEAVFGRKVDVLTRSSLRPGTDERILADAMPL